MRIISVFLCLLVAAAVGADSGNEQSTRRSEQRTKRGPVSAVVRVEPDSVRIGDPVSLIIEVTAQAEVELLMPVFGASLERFTILEFVPREHIDADGRTVSTQRYQLQAPASGEHTIPPITIEFVDRRQGQRATPKDEDAYELLTERLAFTVESVVPADAGSQLKPPLGPLAALDSGATRHWPWAVATVGAILAGAVVVVVMRLRGHGRQRSAYDIASTRLEALEARPRPGADGMDAFFVELSDLVRHYLENRFTLHAPELTTEEFLDVAAASPDLTRNHRSFLQTFLHSADQVKFARFVPAADDVETALSAVRGFLQQTADDDAQSGAGATSAANEVTRA